MIYKTVLIALRSYDTLIGLFRNTSPAGFAPFLCKDFFIIKEMKGDVMNQP